MQVFILIFLYSLANIAQYFSFCLISKIRPHPSSRNESCHGHQKDNDNETTTTIYNHSLTANTANGNEKSGHRRNVSVSYRLDPVWSVKCAIKLMFIRQCMFIVGLTPAFAVG